MFRVFFFLFHLVIVLEIRSTEILVLAPRISFGSTSSVQIFNEEDIHALQVRTLGELLKHTVSGGLHSNGPYGKASSISIRGTDKRHALILVDGIEIGDTTAIHGEARPEFISLQDVEKIEILRGSQGVLYGSKAMGGVIKITTKQDPQDRETFLRFGYGQHEDKQIGLSVSERRKKFYYSLSGDYQDVKGISSYPERKDSGADSDSYSNKTLNANLSYIFVPGSTLQGGMRFIKAFYEFDDVFQDNPHNNESYTSRSFSLKHKNTRSEIWHPEISYSSRETKRDVHVNGIYYPYRGKDDSAELINNIFYGKNGSITFGVKHQNEKARALGQFHEEVEQKSHSLYINNSIKKGIFFSDQGIRWDKFEFSGEKFTYRGGLGFRDGKTTIRTNYATGLRAPSLYSLYGPIGGNRSLLSEQSKSFEFGLEQDIEKTQIGVTFFRIDYDHYIDFVGGRYGNTGDFSTAGVEFELEAPLGKSFLSQVYATFLKAKNKNTSAPPLHRPRWRGGGHLDYFFDDTWRIGVDGVFVGERESFSNERVHLPAHYTLDLRVSYQTRTRENFQIKIGNLMNHQYEEIAGYATLGRTIKAQYTLTL